MSLLPLLFAAAQAHDLRVDVLDVGQGDSILVTVGNQDKVLLIDAGDASAGVTAQLLARGVNRVDIAISTHLHADHIGGMSTFLRAYPIGGYIHRGGPYATRTWAELDATLHDRQAAGLRVFDTSKPLGRIPLAPDTTLTLLFPLPGEWFEGSDAENDNSLVFRLDHGSDCFLFMGDAGARTERVLLARGLQTCDVLKVGHHGSNGASSADFLAAVRPRDALVSVGRNNPYGHPGVEATARLAQSGANIWRTDELGALTVWSTGHGWTITPAPPPVPVPVVRDAPPSTGPTYDAVCPYPASRNSEVFHQEGCGMAGRIYAENLQCYPSREAAFDSGRRPGQCCHP